MSRKEIKVTPERVALEKSMRYNPLRGLTPKKITEALDDFESGYISDFARLAERIRKRDDIVAAACDNRELAISGLEWSIVPQGDDENASKRHKEVLEDFYNGLRATSVDVPDRVGGVKLLIEQMMTARAMQYSVHEIVWQPSLKKTRAEFRFVPLWYFETTTGKLKFKRNSFDTFGVDMLPGEWLVCAAKYPLMEPASSIYLLKRLALGDWSLFGQRFGSGVPAYKTSAKKDSTEWDQARSALAGVVAGAGIILSKDDEFNLLQASASGLPYPEFVDRMDRALVVVFEGRAGESARRRSRSGRRGNRTHRKRNDGRKRICIGDGIAFRKAARTF